MSDSEFKQLKLKAEKKRHVRKKRDSFSDEEEINQEEFDKTRELQKLRKRPAGTNIVTLALGKKINKIEEVIVDDPFKLNSGGLVTGKDMKGYKTKNDAYDVGTQFYKETHIRDEDDEMKKFIETEMGKIKGKDLEIEKESEGSKYLSPEDAALQALPEHLKKSTFKKDQQMLSAQMLAGIPEVDLGIEVKIQNIERTERAKRDLLAKGEINTGGLAMARNANSSHARFSDTSGSLGSDGRFEPNVFGDAAIPMDSARWASEHSDPNGVEAKVRRDMLQSGAPRSKPEGSDYMMNRNENSFAKDYDGVAGDEAALKKFKEMENAQQKQKKRK